MAEKEIFPLPQAASDTAWSPPLRESASGADFARYSRYLLAVAVFFGAWGRLRIGPINLTLADVAAIGSLLLLMNTRRPRGAPFGPLTPFWVGGLGLMLGGLLVSSIFNGDPVRWLVVAGQYAFAYFVLPSLIMSQDRAFALRLCVFYVLGVATSELAGIIGSYVLTYTQATSMFGPDFLSGNGRVGAMSGNVNANGAAVAFAAAMLVYVLRRRLLSPLIGLVVAVLLGWGLLLSASFTGFFATTVSLCVVVAVIGPRYAARFVGIAAVGAVIFYASGAPVPAIFQKRVGNALESGDIVMAGTFDHRAELIAEAWRFTNDYSVIGMGVDQYRVLTQFNNPVHNLYLLIWNEGGVIALLGLVTLIIVAFTLAITKIRQRSEAALVLAVLCVFLIYSASFPHMYSRDWMIPVMVALSTIYARGPAVRQVEDRAAALPG